MPMTAPARWPRSPTPTWAKHPPSATPLHDSTYIVTAIVPALIGAGGGRGLAAALAHGYRPAMIALGGLCAAARS
jgi:hypothetical protein